MLMVVGICLPFLGFQQGTEMGSVGMVSYHVYMGCVHYGLQLFLWGMSLIVL